MVRSGTNKSKAQSQRRQKESRKLKQLSRYELSVESDDSGLQPRGKTQERVKGAEIYQRMGGGAGKHRRGAREAEEEPEEEEPEEEEEEEEEQSEEDNMGKDKARIRRTRVCPEGRGNPVTKHSQGKVSSFEVNRRHQSRG
jgi:hypothetical protein